MIGSMQVLDVLQERGYTPQEDAPAREGWFDLDLGAARVRAVLTPEDGCWIYLFVRNMVPEWEARFLNAPGAVFLATLDAAEREAQEIDEMQRRQRGRDVPCPDCGGVGSAHANACDPD